MDGDDEYRNARLKFIPRVIKGPWVAKKAVKSTAVIMGRKVKVEYYKGPNYFEIDVHADSSRVAASIIKIIKGFSKSITTEMVWLLESQIHKDLPERVMASICSDKIDLDLDNVPFFDDRVRRGESL